MHDRPAKASLSYFGLITILLVAILNGCRIEDTPTSQVKETTPANPVAPTTIAVQTTGNRENNQTTAEPPRQAPLHPPASTTPKPTSTHRPEPTETATATALPSPTPIIPCEDRNPPDDELVLVTLEYGISRDYSPPDLLELSDHFPVTVTLGYPSQVRVIVLEPLSQMIDDMLKADLQPQIISGYRSYASQSIAWNKWRERVGDRASIVSAPPGHSEHQLGTTIDFGSPELALIVDEEDVRFHTYFYKTSEGQWLADNAHNYGFTLSFTRETFELAGLYYEPWHFRYIGPELAISLKEENITLIQYLLEKHGPPCILN